MGSLLGLAQRLERRVENIESEANDRAVTVGRAVLRHLVSVTPVDTSKALSNWQVGVGARPSGDIPPYASGRFGSTADTSVNSAIAAGEAAFALKKPGQTLYISNVTPYIGELDQGSSTQFAGNFRAAARLIARKVLESFNTGIR